MKTGKPSQTAAMVAFFRALADAGLTTAEGFSDPVARRLLPPAWERLAKGMLRGLERVPAEGRRAMARHLDIVPLRMLAIDAEVDAAVAAGCGQAVILGAGLDTRAWRLAVLAGVDVFEVDHPSTGAWKRSRVGALTLQARSITFVPVDFEHDRLDVKLQQAGHRADVPTVWVWEGVVMYLTDAAMQSTLRYVADRSAAGSVLIVHYHEPGQGADQTLTRMALRWWREPQIGQRRRTVMHHAIERCGLVVDHDSSTFDWATAFGAERPEGSLADVGRLVVARQPPA